MTSRTLDKNKNEDEMKLLISRLKHRLDKIGDGGGKAKIEKEHAKGK